MGRSEAVVGAVRSDGNLYILMVKLIGFTHGLDVGPEKKGGGNGNGKVLP